MFENKVHKNDQQCLINYEIKKEVTDKRKKHLQRRSHDTLKTDVQSGHHGHQHMHEVCHATGRLLH